jgi:hypothetical protein
MLKRVVLSGLSALVLKALPLSCISRDRHHVEANNADKASRS